MFVIPFEQMTDCANILTENFERITPFRMIDPESMRFRQILVFGVRRNIRGARLEESRRRMQSLARHDGYALALFPVRRDGFTYAMRRGLTEPMVFRIAAGTIHESNVTAWECGALGPVGSIAGVLMRPVRYAAIYYRDRLLVARIVIGSWWRATDLIRAPTKMK